MSNQISPGMVLSMDGKIYRVESCVKVTVAKGSPFVKAKLRDLLSDELTEKNFKQGQAVDEVSLSERKMEFLYPEGKEYLFLDVTRLDRVSVPAEVIGNKSEYLKEGIEVKATSYGDTVFSLELPQFLELMIVKTESRESRSHVSNATKIAVLESGAQVEVPSFVESGDIIKVNTHTNEYVQRV